MPEVTDQQAELIQLWVSQKEHPDAFEECAKLAGYDYRPGTYRKLRYRLLGLQHFKDAMQRCREGRHPQPSKDPEEIKERLMREEKEALDSQLGELKKETLESHIEHLKANKQLDAEWVLSEAHRLYTLALAEEKLSMAKQMLELIAKHKAVDAMASTSNVQVNVFTDQAERLLIEGRRRVSEGTPHPQEIAHPPPPKEIPPTDNWTEID